MYVNEWYHKNSWKLSDSLVSSWQIPILIVTWFYECEYVYDICIYIFVCILYEEERTMREPVVGKTIYFVCYICWHVNTCWKKGLCGSRSWRRRYILYVISVDMWIHVGRRGCAEAGGEGRRSIMHIYIVWHVNTCWKKRSYESRWRENTKFYFIYYILGGKGRPRAGGRGRRWKPNRWMWLWNVCNLIVIRSI